MKQAMIFDMDGVIVDSEPLHIRAERMTLAPFRLDISDEAFHAYMGRTPRILLEGIIRDYGLDVSIEDLYPVHMKNLVRLYTDEVEAIPGAMELIRNLEQRGVPLAIASSSDHALIRAVLDKFHLKSVFRSVVSGEDVEHVKPFPDIFLRTAENLKVKPEFCWVIEDSAAGVRAAKAAGMTCIGFRSPNSPNQDLSPADFIAERLDAVPSLLMDRFFS